MNQMKSNHEQNGAQQLEAAEIKMLTWESEKYPKLLRTIEKPPKVLYYLGDLAILDRLCVSIVGSRRAGAYGQKVAYEVAADLAKAGFAVVSGLAMGIDACGHKGALDAGGKTVAVMPCGLDLCYPKTNRWLYHRICRDGLAISEYPPGKKPEKWHFVERNRLVSGLSIATVVAQAGPKSGSIRTAQLAAEQGREVFGVPGDIFDAEYLGVHNLIQDGANVLTSSQSLIRMLKQQTKPMYSEKKLGHAVTYEPKRKADEENNQLLQKMKLEREEKRRQAGQLVWLYDQVDEFGCQAETICQRTGRDAVQVQQAITLLELQGLIRKDAQQQIVRV